MNRVYKSTLTILTFLLFSVLVNKNVAHALIPIVEKFKLDPQIVSCVIISSSIDNKLNGFENSKAKHMQVYTILTDRLEQKIEKWNGWGYDTDQIEEDLNTLKEKIDEYEKDFDDFSAKLEDLKSFCGDTQYSTKVSEIKNLLKEVRKDVVDVRNFYQVTIRKDILALKNQELD